MSAQSTQSGAGQGLLASVAPTYGGVETGGARRPTLDGGATGNRAMAEGEVLLNGVGVGGPFEDSQLPHVPMGRPGPTGSRATSQDDVRMVDAPSSSARPVTTSDVGTVASRAAGTERDTATDVTRSSETGPGASGRRFQGEAFGLRSRPGQQQTLISASSLRVLVRLNHRHQELLQLRILRLEFIHTVVPALQRHLDRLLDLLLHNLGLKGSSRRLIPLSLGFR
eukprot:s344_g16.t1